MHYPTSGEEHRVLRVLWRIKNDPETLLSPPAPPFPRRTTPLHNMAAGAVLHLPSRGSSSAPPAAAPAPAGPESRARLKPQRCGDLHPLPRLDVPCLAWLRQLWDGEEARPRWWPRLRPVVFARSGRHQSWSRNTQDALNSKTCFPFRGC